MTWLKLITLASSCVLLLVMPAAGEMAHIVPRVLVIGDSISLGEGAGGAGPDCPLTAETARPEETYAARISRGLGADLTRLAISGRGLVHNYDGFNAPVMQEWLAQNNYKRLPGAQSAPDLVLINLGTNDFHHNDPEPAFSEAYATLLTTLRARYPKALIYGLFGPMLDGADAEQADEAVHNAIRTQAATGDKRVYYVRFRTDTADAAMLGCSWHPSSKAHAQMALVLMVRLLLDRME